MLARGIRSYHRPARLEDAQGLASQGVRPFAGGTRLFATAQELPNVLDLSALGFSGLRIEENDLVIGSTTTIQDVLDCPESWSHSAGLLPLACRASLPSRTARHMASLGGEAVHGAFDSDIVAALLALNAIFVVAHPSGEVESPAMRFLRRPDDDLDGGGILRAVVLPGVPHGAALERASFHPSSPPIVSVATAVTLADSRCIRARIALTGLDGPPLRATEAEGLLERTGAPDDAIAAAADLVAERRPFRSDGMASADARRKLSRQLAERALRSALARARSGAAVPKPNARRAVPPRSQGALAYFTSGRIEINVDGRLTRPDVEAGTTLLEALRSEGVTSVREGCSAGDCGTCTVLLDGRPTLACLTPALRAQGRTVQTSESLVAAQSRQPLLTAFVSAASGGCGFCTPGLMNSARGLLLAIPDPDEGEMREALAGHLCRCIGTERAVEALSRVVAAERGEDRA